MGWEKRGNREYYYKPARVDGKPRKIYLGSGPVGRTHELLDRQAARKKQPILEAQARVRHLIREGDRLWRETWSWIWPLGESHMLLAGYYRHRGQWRKAHQRPRTRQSRVPTAVPEVPTDLREYMKALNRRANGGEPEAIEALRVFIDKNAAILLRIEDLNRVSFALWAVNHYTPLVAGITGSPDFPLERLLNDAVRIAELNRGHAASLIEPGVVSAMALSTRYMRIERADNRLRDAQRLLSRVRTAGGCGRGSTDAEKGLIEEPPCRVA